VLDEALVSLWWKKKEQKVKRRRRSKKLGDGVGFRKVL
jgi:hypothetical protein